MQRCVKFAQPKYVFCIVFLYNSFFHFLPLSFYTVQFSFPSYTVQFSSLLTLVQISFLLTLVQISSLPTLFRFPLFPVQISLWGSFSSCSADFIGAL